MISCDFYCSVALPHGALGWPMVCDYGISRPYSLMFFVNQANLHEALTKRQPNRNCLGQFHEIPWNQTTDVHRGSTLIMTLTLYNVTLMSQKPC